MDAHYSPRDIVIRPAESADELAMLYRFRYRIYVEEMGRRQNYANHSAKFIEDPLDSFATNLIACDATGSIVGAVRGNRASDGDLGGYTDFYAMQSAGDAHPRSTSICTRLMIAPAQRHSTLAVKLIVALYEIGLRSGITHNFMDCNDHLVQFFTGLGFVQHVPQREHDEYGLVTCMRLTLHDRSHLERLLSPFLEALDRWASSVAVAEDA